jgi:hypothetical protein
MAAGALCATMDSAKKKQMQFVAHLDSRVDSNSMAITEMTISR